MAQPLKKRKPKPAKRWAYPILDLEIEDVDDEIVQTKEKKEASAELN